MLDKKKLAALIVAGVVVIVGLTVVITLGLSGGAGKQRAAEPVTASPSATATPTATDLELTTDEMSVFKTAGEAAAKFDNRPGSAVKPADYVKAGFTESLANSYKPIWAGLFAGRADQNNARIESQVGGLGGAGVLKQSLKVLDYSGSKPGSYTIRVAVDVAWVPQEVKPSPGKQMGGTSQSGHAIWTLTYDQLSQRILKVEQPAWQDLGAEGLFDAMGLPVPTKGADTAAQGGTK
ncbi:hypothetical protein [Paenarthrobacter ureafaciens]|uniref:hypothetical protein n=1 Tax=Paenarthrobacter ureafaciens TaxID=37931 RepID=UPI0009ACCF47|nr:hypothetical protein [Paenarthrobacter ureafaciens]GLU61566.1 hypothetical protein Pure01_40790 [Paenarthrobacter ureafaciens]GLU65855.1 hypothetical protein Pure02_41050 [Paenarthrobacter ureafaciens]GLU70152.1 hypothetical protein Pure03_41280 [Paenarthrobacter ureafaciens]GLU74411.1 hypothetical protein Pure04_41260 [Paenarthrobacter ureafaciens]GLU78651.1 hypothetical protein Pure05_40910 [Paenarthrobacter ureafaciens]